jgi:16S rRNA (uracil1498-N3)-methyltransferase
MRRHSQILQHGPVPRFFIGSDQIHDGSVVLIGADAEHLARSLRVRPGEEIVVVEAGTTEHGVRVVDVGAAQVLGRVAWSRPATGEPSLEVHVLQALPAKGMDAAIEALSECGVASIRPVITARTIARPDAARVSRRLDRWALIARESAQLAGRARAPEVHAPQPLRTALQHLPAAAQLLACVANTSAVPLRRVDLEHGAPVAVAVGPEGGFDSGDRHALAEAGAREVHLGPRILPNWLAGSIAVSIVLAAAGDLDTPAGHID